MNNTEWQFIKDLNAKTKDLLKDVEKINYDKGVIDGRAKLMEEQLEMGYVQPTMDDV